MVSAPSIHWKEKLDPNKHRDFMLGHQDPGGLPVEPPRNNLLHAWPYFVDVAGFTFQFASTDQIHQALLKLAHFVRMVANACGFDNSIANVAFPPGSNCSAEYGVRLRGRTAVGDACFRTPLSIHGWTPEP